MKTLKLTISEGERALELHQKAIIIDGTVLPSISPSSFQRLSNGGVTAACVTVPAIYSAKPAPNFREAVNEIADRLHWLMQSEGKGMLATCASDIELAKEKEKVSIVFSPQNTNIIEGNSRLLEVFYRLGVRISQLTYNKRNEIGDGAYERTDCGLSDFGLHVIEEMNRLRMLIDLSHCGKSTTIDAIEASKVPVTISHANALSLCSHARNKSDEQIQTLAEKGGVMGITIFSTFLRTKECPKPTIEDFLGNIDYVVNLVGVDHVGIGTDLDETMTEERWATFKRTFPQYNLPEDLKCYVEGFESLESYINVTKGLVFRGYSDQEIMKILGGNFLRVFREVWGK